MAVRDEEYLPEAQNEIEKQKQEAAAKKSKIHFHSTIITDAATGNQKLSCNYCPKAYSYSGHGGNTSTLVQHFRVIHRDIDQVVRDYPENAEIRISQAKAKRQLNSAGVCGGSNREYAQNAT